MLAGTSDTRGISETPVDGAEDGMTDERKTDEGSDGTWTLRHRNFEVSAASPEDAGKGLVDALISAGQFGDRDPVAEVFHEGYEKVVGEVTLYERRRVEDLVADLPVVIPLVEPDGERRASESWRLTGSPT